MLPHVCYKPSLISMKYVLIFTLLLACGTGSVKAQNSINILKTISSKQLLALNFIGSISGISQNFSKVNTVNKENKVSSTENKNIPQPEIIDPIERISPLQFKYAMMMDVDVESLNNSVLYMFIEEWYGTRYRMGGTTKKGIDCSALSRSLLSTVYSFDVPRTAREQYKICDHINKEDLMTGDLVFFNTRGGVSHVGVYLTDNHFVHSSSSQGVKISSLDEDYYSRKFICGGRVNQ